MEKIGVTKKEGAVLESGLLIQNIDIRPVKREKSDIQDWRQNHQQAEAINGSRIALYDMYDDALLDAFLSQAVDRRILGVTKNNLRYIGKQRKEIAVKGNLLNLLQFRLLRESIQKCKAWGIGVFELINDNGKLKFFDVPKKHIRPAEGKILFEQYGVEGINYKTAPYSSTVFQIGRHDDLGYLLSVVPYVLYKRGNIADWANYAQIFGMPFREARYDGFSEIVRIQLERALEAAGSAAWAVLPKDVDFKIHEAQNAAGSNDLFGTLRKAMNEEILVAVLGATEMITSSKNSGLAQSAVHKETVNELAQDDMQKELATLNSLVLPILINIGLMPPGGTIIYENPVNIDIAEKQIAIAQQMQDLGLGLNDNQIYEITGLRKPANYEVEKEKLSAEIEHQKTTDNMQEMEPTIEQRKSLLAALKRFLFQK